MWFSCAEDLLRGEPPTRAHDPAARMRPRAALPEAVQRRAVLRPLGHGTQEEELVQRQLALEDVPLAQARDALDVRRRDHLLADDERLDVRRVLRERLDDGVAERVAL